MYRSLHFTIRMVVMAVYLIYAISPVYSSVLTARSASRTNHSDSSKKELTFGIVMLNVMLSNFLDGQTADAPDDTDNEIDCLIKKKRAITSKHYTLAPPPKSNEIDFLVSKKRAVLREQAQFTPIAEIVVIPPEDPASALYALSNYDTTINHCRHQAPDGYFALDSGLSPPVSLS